MKPITKKEIKETQDQRQRPLTENDDTIEGLENCIVESIEIRELYEQVKKSIDEDIDTDIPFKKITDK
jgi:hypothetical protein